MAVRTVVIPASRTVLLDANEKGYISSIIEAGATLGPPGCGLCLDPVVEKDKAYLNSWWKVIGRVLVDKKGVKSGIVSEIAKMIGQSRK